jgi:hypothetical protein
VTCRWDSDAGDYLLDGEPCRTDDYGDATKHCTARRTCSNHVGPGEITCAKCLGRTRNDVGQLEPLAALMPAEAEERGLVSTDATMFGGPVADMDQHAEHREALWHRLTTWEILGRITERQFAKEVADERADDESHPANILGVWCRMWAEDYGLELPDTSNLGECVRFVNVVLHRVAQDDEQDFPLFAREVRACRNRMESTLRNSQAAERGAPCPACPSATDAGAPRLVRHYGHYCEDPDCTQLHYPEDPDVWICPRDSSHCWEEDDYRKWVADVYEANKVGA